MINYWIKIVTTCWFILFCLQVSVAQEIDVNQTRKHLLQTLQDNSVDKQQRMELYIDLYDLSDDVTSKRTYINESLQLAIQLKNQIYIFETLDILCRSYKDEPDSLRYYQRIGEECLEGAYKDFYMAWLKAFPSVCKMDEAEKPDEANEEISRYKRHKVNLSDKSQEVQWEMILCSAMECISYFSPSVANSEDRIVHLKNIHHLVSGLPFEVSYKFNWYYLTRIEFIYRAEGKAEEAAKAVEALEQTEQLYDNQFELPFYKRRAYIRTRSREALRMGVYSELLYFGDIIGRKRADDIYSRMEEYYQSKTPEEFYRRLDRLMDISARSLHIKREVITKLLNEGLYPYTKRYLGSFDNHFSTIGLVGMNEAGLNAKWLGCDMSDPRTQKFTKEVLTHMRNRLSDYQEEYPGELFNLEATPAESTAYRLAKHDRKRWPDIRTAGSKGDTPYYTNSSHLPVEYSSDIFDALDIQDELQTLYTSGTVFHAFLGEKLPDWKAAASLVRKIAENYKLPYYTISPTYSVCKEHGYLSGEHFTCPKCGKKAEVYSRITGYYRPVQNWNDGKAQEYKNRTLYDVLHSKLKKVHTSMVTVTDDDVKIEPVETHKYLFTTNTCPNCRMAKKMLEGEDLEIIDAEKNPDMARQFGIMQAPTLVITDGEHLKKYVNASNIQKYVDEELD